MCDLSLTSARKANQPWRVKWATERTAQVREVATAFGRRKTALAVLDREASNPVQTWSWADTPCFMKNDFASGLPMLALGSDAGLKALAQQDVAGSADPNAMVALGDAWSRMAGRDAGIARKRMALRAIKWYSAALPSASGAAKTSLEQRIAVMQRDTGGIGTMTPDEVMSRFSFTNTSFHVDRDAVTGKADPLDKAPFQYILLTKALNLQAFEFGFNIKTKSYQMAAVEIDGRIYEFSRGHWWNGATRIFDGKEQHRVEGKVDQPDKWAAIRVVVNGSAVAFFYNGDAAGSCSLVAPTTPTTMVQVGFTSHNAEVSIKDVYLIGQ